jgi:dynein heavy chain
MEESTVLFGMHENANTTYLKQEEKKLMDTLRVLQPRDVTGAGKSSQEIVLEIVSGVLERKEVPELLDLAVGHKTLFEKNDKGLLPSLSTFLIQEVHRFNKLLKIIGHSLEDLKKAIKGLILLSDDLDAMFYDLLANKVPANWKKAAYPSLKPLASWLKDLKERTQFVRNWLEEGSITSYWLSSFFFPQGFLTGVLQEHARQPEKEIPIDELVFAFKFTEISKEGCPGKPPEGIYISGLILEGGSFDTRKKLLTEPIKVYHLLFRMRCTVSCRW